MGKSSKRLRVLLTDAKMLEWPEVVKLTEQGYEFDVVQDTTFGGAPIDLVIGPNAHLMSESNRPWFDRAILEGRCRRYGHTKNCGHAGSATTTEEDPDS